MEADDAKYDGRLNVGHGDRGFDPTDYRHSGICGFGEIRLLPLTAGFAR
jgi:hypothetical protein